MKGNKPALHTALSPSMLHLYDAHHTIVVIIDVLRATSTIATALYNGASCVIPVDSVARCIELGNIPGAVTAGERDGRIAEGLARYSAEYSRTFIENKGVLPPMAGLLYMARKGAQNIITAPQPVGRGGISYQPKSKCITGCAAWKDRVNIEDTLLPGPY